MTNLAKITPAADAPHQADPLLAVIERVVIDPELDMDRLSALLDVRERQLNKEAEQAFNAAFAAAMANMPDVPKSGKNKHTEQRYSTLDDLIRTTRPVLSEHGLSLNWETGILDDGRIRVKAIVRHALGHQISTEQAGARDSGKAMNNLQGGGSTETYLKRYSGFALLGLASGDEAEDDGQGANQRITEDQFRALRDQIEATGADEDRLCKYFKVERISELPAASYGRADALLRQKAKEAS